MSELETNRYRKCPICGGYFRIPDVYEWAYKARVKTNAKYKQTKFVCSYSCMRKAEREDAEEREARL